MNDDLNLQPRETWNTRGAFVLAAIGSAVGLGNLWGFPYKLYTYGGGAFLIPYFIAMAVMGIPMLIMEFSVGHWAQTAAPGAFAKVMKKHRFVGWWLVAVAFIIIMYYAVILGYCVHYLTVSVVGLTDGILPWTAKHPDIAQNYFLKSVVAAGDGFKLGPLAGKVVIGTVVSWILIYVCLFRGVKWVGKVVLLTVPLPWIMLMILTMRGLTLEGAISGLEFYLEPRWAKLLEADTWRWAFGQVFFSMSLGFAVMLSYASFLHRKSDLNNNALIIGLGDLGTSFIAGIAVFSMLGGMAHAAAGITGEVTAVSDLVPSGTVGLSFMVFPYGLTQLPAAAFFSCVFFLALLTLGIDSAFSIVEACLASVCDSKPKWPRAIVLPIICGVGLLSGLVFTCKGGGLNLLALTDGLVNGPFGILILALAECLVVGWAWRGKFLRKMRDHANERSDWTLHGWWEVTIKYVAPTFLMVLIVWSVSEMIHGEIDKHRAIGSEASAQLRKIWPDYDKAQKAFKPVDEEWKMAEARAFRAHKLGDKEKMQQAEADVARLRPQRDSLFATLRPIEKQVKELEKKDAVADEQYAFPWALACGSLLFIALPFFWWFASRGRKEAEDEAKKELTGVRRGVVFALVVMVISAIVIEAARAKEWLAAREVDFKADGELNATAYTILAVALLVIFGGLTWCFWRAMQAAGRRDPQMGNVEKRTRSR